MNLETSVIPIWVITYDEDPSLMYVMNDQEQLLRSIEGALSEYIEEEEFIEEVCNKIRSAMYQNRIYIQYTVENVHSITIIRIDLDNATKIHKLFVQCLDHLKTKESADTVIDVLDLFEDPDQLTAPPL